MWNFIKRLICKIKGHNFEEYGIYTEVGHEIIEVAGFCKRCGYDTHEGYKN